MPPLLTALEWLYSVQLFGIKPGLDNTRRLLRELALPGSSQRFIHVAGTNGKGSTCAFIESILRTAGERTGLFTSPHLVSFCERMRFRGEMPAMEEVEHAITALRPIVSGWNPHPTFFELTLALALDWLDRRGAEIIVLETGMGGRMDATNVIAPAACVITPIDMDHQQWLGSTLAEIAAEKAGIIKPGVPVVCAPQRPEAEALLRETAARLGAPITFIDAPWLGPLPLPGRHQQWNAALAAAAVDAAGFRVPEAFIRKGLADTCWPARFQRVQGGRFIIDGAHNPHGSASLIAAWRHEYGAEKAHIVFGAVAAKEFAASLLLLGQIAVSFSFVTVNSPRAVPAAELASHAPAGIPVRCFDSLPSALEGPARMLICGSLYLCGEALALLCGGAFEPSAQ